MLAEHAGDVPTSAVGDLVLADEDEFVDVVGTFHRIRAVVDVDKPVEVDVHVHQSKHVPAVYGAQARELASGNDPSAGDEEIRWAIEQTSPTIREVVRRFPKREPSRTRLATLFYELDTGLRR